MLAFDGIGLAAPQVGIMKRIIVIDDIRESRLKDWHGSFTVKVDGKVISPDEVFPLKLINPYLAKTEETVEFPYDGCLSFPGVERAITSRHKSIVLHAKTVLQEQIEIECDGLLSICLQHELDHLDGIFFIDRSVREIEEDIVVEDIKAFENDPEYRKMIKKLKPVDARSQKFGFV